MAVRIFSRWCRWLAWGVLFCLFGIAAFSRAAELEELSDEEARQVQIAERFLDILMKNPRRGTALDRVYGHHVEFGTLDAFLEDLDQRLQNNPQDGAGWMLLGLIQSQRGADAQAAETLQQAETHRPTDPLASYYLAQSLLRIGESEAAVAAFERALARNPARADLLEISQQLGRVHQRAQRVEQALAVWQRLESQFPDDPRVLEQIAITLAEEGALAEALPRYQRLAELVRDDYRRVTFKIQVAELTIRLGDRQEGLDQLETLLADLNPDGWLFRDVRRRIEEVFLKAADQDGLVKYYQQWLEKRPDDVEAMARLARFLASSARMPEAREWMERALERAPSRGDLRRAFIDQLIDDQRIGEAIEQYRLLAESSPGNPDYLRDWGRLVLRDRTQDIAERRREAGRIWRLILAARPDDALTAAQVADLFRQADMPDEAVELYQRAIDLAPGTAQYREYLGEFYHHQKQPDRAIETWEGIAAGSHRTAANVARLAEVYYGFGYLDRAIRAMDEACRLAPRDFHLHLRAAEYQLRAERYETALELTEAAGKLAATGDEREAVLARRIEVLQASQQLDEQTDRLAAAVRGNPSATAEDWQLVARYFEAARRWTEAIEAAEAALQREPKSLPALATAARVLEVAGDLGRAAELHRRLADADRRARGEHLMSVARLESQLGRADQALQAARDLIVTAPGNTDHYEFYAQLCRQLGRPDEGLQALRKAVRINPNQPHLIMALGSALADQLRTDEAIEIYWRAFDRSDDIDDKTSLTLRLVPLYQQINQWDQLIERLERQRREEPQRRVMTICLAQAHHAAGDYGTARHELESLLSDDTRDTHLLQQLAKLCQEAGDLDAAIGYQRQLVAVAPGHETEMPLAAMLQEFGERDEATEILVRLTAREDDPVRLLQSVDSLLSQGSFEAALRIVEPLLGQQRDDWELLYREGVALANLERMDEAAHRFQRLLALNLPHQTLGQQAAARWKEQQARARRQNLAIAAAQSPDRSPLLRNEAHTVRPAVGLGPDYDDPMYGGPGRGPIPRIWTPDSFAVARMAAYGWLLRFEREQQRSAADQATGQPEPPEPLAERLARRAADPAAPVESIYDWIYVGWLLDDHASVFQAARRLARGGGPAEREFFLQSLTLRHQSPEFRDAAGREQTSAKTPLNDEGLSLMLECFDALDDGERRDVSASHGGQVAYSSDGQAYVNVGGRWMPLPQASRVGRLGIVYQELQLAGREPQAEELLQQRLSQSQTTAELRAAMNVLLELKKREHLPDIFDRWTSAALQEIRRPDASVPAGATRGLPTHSANQLAITLSMLANWIGILGPEEELAQILDVLDAALDVAAAQTQRQREERTRLLHRPAAAARPSGPRSMHFRYGAERHSRVQVDFPNANAYVDDSALLLLRVVYEVFQRHDAGGELLTHLRQRLERAEGGRALGEQMLLGAVLWWTDEQDEAVTLLGDVYRSLPDEIDLQFELISMHILQEDFEEALEIVDAIAPRDQQVLQRRELIALQLAERLGDRERARQAAERLFGLRLDANTQLALAEQMRRLGLHAMAESVAERLQRQAGSQTSTLASLMMLYQGQGKTDEAKQLAHVLLRRTVPPVSAMAASARNPLRYSTTENHVRTQALQVLQQTGELTALIEQLEEQRSRSPDAPRLYEQLIEYYNAANRRDKVGELLEQAVARRPDAPVFRYQLAQHLERTGKAAEACDHYLELLRQKPEWLADNLYSIRQLFQRAERTMDLVEAIREIDVKALDEPTNVLDLAGTLLRDKTHSELALDLLEKVFEAFPNYRGYAISRLRHVDGLYQFDRVYELAMRVLLPASAGEVARNPWFGFDGEDGRVSGGQLTLRVHGILAGVTGTRRLDELRQTIEEHIERHPDWLGGRAILALIDMRGDRREAGRQKLVEMAGDRQTIAELPRNVSWAIGQELDRFPETRDTAIALLERAVVTDASSYSSPIEIEPVARLVRLYADQGHREDARSLLLKHLGNRRRDQHESYRHAQNVRWASQRLLELDFAVDVIRLNQQLLADPDILQAVRRYGSREDYAKLANEVIEQALTKLAAMPDGPPVDQLLTVPENVPTGTAALDLLLVLPEAYQTKTEPVSRLVDLLASMSTNPQTAAAVDRRLSELWQQHPADLSLGIALALHRLHTQHDKAVETLALLEQCIAANPLEPLLAGRRANARQRREAALSVPLWLVARECLRDGRYQATGQRLAERALAGAQRQLGYQHTSMVLSEWARLLLDRGDRPQAEEKWSQLLTAVTERPMRRHAPDGADAADSTARDVVDTVAPLTDSQFTVALSIASNASEHGMARLSQEAVRQMLLAGLPVAAPDPASLDASQSRGGTIRVQTLQTVRFEAELARLLQGDLAQWRPDDYPPGEVYPLLRDLVLPPSRPADILMLADSARLHEARAASLGGTLVAWSRRADRLDELAGLLAQRETQPGTEVAALVLRVLTALAADRDDDAREPLQQLARQSEAGLPAGLLELACHAALPAAERPGLEEPAMAILQRTLRMASSTPSASFPDATLLSGRLAELVHRHLARREDAQAVRQHFETLLADRQAVYARQGGEYALVQQQRDLGQLADQAARIGMPELALDLLGRVQDFPASRYSPPPLALPLAVVCRTLRAEPAADRYLAWRDWTMPAEQRQMVRLVIEFIPPDQTPAALVPLSPQPGAPLDTDLLCNLTELVDAAADAGMLDELEQGARAAVERRLPNAEFLLPLVLLRQGDADGARQAITALLETLPERTRSEQNQPRPDLHSDFVVYRACLQSGLLPDLVPTHTARLRKATQDLQRQDLLARLNFEFARHTAQNIYGLGDRSYGRQNVDGAIDPGLVHWFAASTRSEPADGTLPWWVVGDRHVAHLAGTGLDLLYFAYPLGGDFSFTVDGFEDRFANADLGFGGTFIEQRPWDNNTSIAAVTGQDEIRRPGQMKLPDGNFNRFRVALRNGTWQFYSNGQLLYEEPLVGSSPWLTLGTFRFRVTAWRNPRFEGDPVIPREVHLLDGDRMDGWNTSFFGEFQPRRRLMAEPVRGERDWTSQQQQREPHEFQFDWSTRDNVLSGRAVADALPDAQSWIYYHRPLRDGETFRYEFFHVPGRSVAHPTVGRMAMVLDAGGVRTHWIARPGWDDAYHGIPLDNELLELEYQQAAAPLPLRDNQWNQVTVTLTDGQALVSLNGAPVFRRPIEPNGDSRFGLFRYKQQSSQVRNAVLTGPWPETVDAAMQRDLLAVHSEISDAQRLFLHRVVDDQFIEHDLPQVVATAREMPDAAAYEYLKRWVLPSPGHPGFRLYLRPVPLYAANRSSRIRQNSGVANESSRIRQNSGVANESSRIPENSDIANEGSRIRQNSGDPTSEGDVPRLWCAAIQLAGIARRIGRLDELQSAVQAADADGVIGQRNRLAMLVLIAIERQDDEAARPLLADLYRLLKDHPPEGLPPRERVAEFVAAWQAALRPELWHHAADLAIQIREYARSETFRAAGSDWGTQVDMLVGRIEALGRGLSLEAPTTGQPLIQWHTVPYHNPETRQKGFAPSVWHFQRGTLQHLPGGTWQQLFFQSPLRGRFEIVLRHSMYGHREILTGYGWHAAQVRWDRKGTRIFTLMRGHRDQERRLDIPEFDALVETRIVVDGRSVTTYFNGERLHQEFLSAPPDPWLVLQAQRPGHPSAVCDLQIIGQPEIPDELDLVDVAFGGAWRADTYGESFGDSPSSDWRRDGDELVAQTVDPLGRPRESLLMYQRPLIEDAEIEFETFHQPGEVEVHPAVGRQAFLLRPDGVRLHRLTGGRFEMTGLSPDNEAAIPGAADQVPLKANAWNHVRLTVRGDRLSVVVNDVQVAEMGVSEAPEERFFGLYRDAGRTRSRIRQIVYRGQWPKTLPPLVDQELALSTEWKRHPAAPDAPSSPPSPPTDSPTGTLHIPLNQSLKQLEQHGLAVMGPTERLTPVERGMNIVLRDAKELASWPGLVLRRTIAGDCDATVTFSGLDIQPVKTGWGVAFGLTMTMDDPQRTQVECRVLRHARGGLVVDAAHRRVLPDGQQSTLYTRRMTVSGAAGQLRLIRQGGEIHCLMAIGDGTPFQWIDSFPVGNAPIRDIAIQAKSSDGAGQVNVVAEELMIRQDP